MYVTHILHTFLARPTAYAPRLLGFLPSHLRFRDSWFDGAAILIVHVVRSFLITPRRKSHTHASLIYKPSNLHVDLLPSLGGLPDRLSIGRRHTPSTHLPIVVTHILTCNVTASQANRLGKRAATHSATGPFPSHEHIGNYSIMAQFERSYSRLREPDPIADFVHRLLDPIPFLLAGNLTFFLTTLLVPPRQRRLQR